LHFHVLFRGGAAAVTAAPGRGPAAARTRAHSSRQQRASEGSWRRWGRVQQLRAPRKGLQNDLKSGLKGKGVLA